jgi:hypothetical protein
MISIMHRSWISALLDRLVLLLAPEPPPSPLLPTHQPGRIEVVVHDDVSSGQQQLRRRF